MLCFRHGETGSIRAGGKLVLFGNGGSAADCQHIAAELSVRYIKDRAPIAAIALTTDTSALTAIAVMPTVASKAASKAAACFVDRNISVLQSGTNGMSGCAGRL